MLESEGKPFPQEPREQLWGAIGAVFGSWNNRRAREYRRLHGISDSLGTGVNVQAMVFGNRGPDCATGVGFTRNPATGERKFFGEYLVNAQGEDVVAGIRTPQPIEGSGAGHRRWPVDFPLAYQQLHEVAERLERHFRDMQDLEFTIEAGKLYLLQTRGGKRTGPAAVIVAVDMAEEGLLTPDEAVQRVEPEQLEQLLAPGFDLDEKRRAIADGRLLAKGLPAGPGAACGRIAMTAERAAEMAADGPVLLVREETSPEDIVGMHASRGILTSRGGMTSHAAVVARGMGKPCIVGADALHVDHHAGELRVGEHVFREGDQLSIDGSTGEVIAGGLSPHPSPVLRQVVDGIPADDPRPVHAFTRLLAWADDSRRLRVRANADTPEDARVARAFGAQGIGLCRTEHMFFAEDRIAWVRRMILARDEAERKEALAYLLPVQQGGLRGHLRGDGRAASDGAPARPAAARVPAARAQGDRSRSPTQMGIEPARLRDDRACPSRRSTRCLATAVADWDSPRPTSTACRSRPSCALPARVQRAGDDVLPEIMLPLVGSEEELAVLRRHAQEVVDRVLAEERMALPVLIGTMIEVPRACAVADRLALHADFFSFGTNDLTQMTYGFSRDDVGRFLPSTSSRASSPSTPSPGWTRKAWDSWWPWPASAAARRKAALKLGICGEHGGEPHSVAFFDSVGLDYVSCSPYRVPIARLAAARCRLEMDRAAEAA